MTKPIATIDDLKPDPRNANRGTERGHNAVRRSIEQRGAGRSGLAARDGTMIAGNQTLEEMAALGMKIKPVHTRGDEWVVVIRDDIEPGSDDATLLALEDNRAAQLGIEWEPGVLAEIAQEVDVGALWTPDELRASAMAEQDEGGPVDPNELWKGMPEFAHEDQTADAAFTIRVFLKNADDLAAFGALLGKDLTDRKFVWFGKQPQGETYEAVDES